MVAPTVFDKTSQKIWEGDYTPDADSFKLVLTNTEPDQANDEFFADLTEISAGNGYTAGGLTVTTTDASSTSGTFSVTVDNITLQASGGSIATFQYAVLIDDAAASKPLLEYWDNGAPVSLADGEGRNLNFVSSGLAFSIAPA